MQSIESCIGKVKGFEKPKLVVLTGGPGAGKTAVLELARKYFCEHITVLPEAASIIFSGGFLRRETANAKMSAQRAIFHVQRELERIALEETNSPVVICDRGTLDGLAYWPNGDDRFFKEMNTTREQEFARYSAVIHLRPPNDQDGYNHQNPVRVESAHEAAEIDRKILKVWEKHPNRVVIESTPGFLEKAARAIQALKKELPSCCQTGQLDS